MSDPSSSRPILVTGGNGQIGHELLRQLQGAGDIVAPTSRELDLADATSIRRAVKEHNPRLIINAGAYTAVDIAETEVERCFAINGAAPGILAEEASRIGAPIVHYSTDYVFDGESDQPYVETDRPNPLNAYGRSKLAGEEAVRSVGGAWLVLRTSWVYATRGKNFLLTMAAMAGKRDTLSVVDDQIGAPTWARAIALATIDIILAAPRGKSSIRSLKERAGLYHLSAAGSTSWLGFAEAIFTKLDAAKPRLLPISSAEYKRPAKRPMYSVLDNTRLNETFGVSMPGWKDQLESAMAFLGEHDGPAIPERP